MSHQNVTITLPVALMREVKHQAVDQGVSLSRYVALLLEAHVDRTRAYRAARDRQQALLRQGLRLGTEGQIAWTREALHER